MGLTYADIELINGYDLENAKRNIIGEEEVKRMKVEMLVETGALMKVYKSNYNFLFMKSEKPKVPMVEL